MNPDQVLSLLRLIASLEAERERLARRVMELEQSVISPESPPVD